jgi:glycerophosphoryl diester phosphodiesterase
VKRSGTLAATGLALLLGALPAPGGAQQASGASTAETRLRMPEIIAHRGASWDAPENTLAAMQLGWAVGADAVEFDIFATADGGVILLHDANTQRTTGRSLVAEESSLAALRELEAGSWKGEQWRGERLPTLDEALATRPPRGRLFVESKSDTRIVEPMLAAFDRHDHLPHELVVITFHYEVAAEVKRQRPRTPVYWLSSFRQDERTGEWSPSMRELVERTRAANLDGLNLRFIGPATMPENVKLIRDAGLGFYVWTVNDSDDAQRALELGVDGITTDRPGWLREQLLARNGWRLLPRP